MTITLNGSGSITGVTTMGTTIVNQTLTTPTITSTLGVGGATPAASGAGITFPASQSASSDANTLDDYEEGTFTPTLTGFTVSGLISNNGYYTKIGRQVHLNIIVQASSISGTGGSCSITGLPFVPGIGNFALVSIGNANTIASQNSGGVINSGAGGTIYPPTFSSIAYFVISVLYWS